MKIDTQNVEWRIIDDEAVILALGTGFYYSFNRTGTEIWRSLSEGKDKSGIVRHIAGRFNVANDSAEKDVDTFLKYLEKEKLLK